MLPELINLGGYGHFVWPAFLFTFGSCFFLYLNAAKELKKHEENFLKNLKYINNEEVIITERKEISKEVLSGSSI